LRWWQVQRDIRQMRGAKRPSLIAGALVAALIAGAVTAVAILRDGAVETRPSSYRARALGDTLHQGGDRFPRGFTIVGDQMLFAAHTDGHGMELWKTDGTRRGTVEVKDINPGQNHSSPAGVALGELYVFAARDGAHGVELWRSDGTERGTMMIKDIAHRESSQPAGFVVAGDLVFFTADDAVHGEELWVTDGSARGTGLVMEIDRREPTTTAYHDPPRELTAVGDVVFFSANDGMHGRELWTSDGTRRGTHMVMEIDPRRGTSGSRHHPSALVAVGDTLYFSADDSVHGAELWRSDGSSAGTTMVSDIAPGPRGSMIAFPVAVGETLFFSAHDRVHGVEPWISDGTPEGTLLARDIAHGSAGSIPWNPVLGDGVAFFTAHDDEKHAQLWSSDGTVGGTTLVARFESDTPCGMQPAATIGGLVFLQGCTLWESDGTQAGTVKVSVNGADRPEPSYEFGVLGRALLFQNRATSGRGESTLWVATPTHRPVNGTEGSTAAPSR
jgi:ELWxxDGT repeat protein